MIVVDMNNGKIGEGEHNVGIRVGPRVGAHLTCALVRCAREHDSGMPVYGCASIVAGAPRLSDQCAPCTQRS